MPCSFASRGPCSRVAEYDIHASVHSVSYFTWFDSWEFEVALYCCAVPHFCWSTSRFDQSSQTTALLSSLSVPYALVPAEDHFDLENELLLYLNVNINPDAVPRLTSLVIRLTNAVPHLLPSFVDMVQSRRNVTPTRAALQTLHLSVRWSLRCQVSILTWLRVGKICAMKALSRMGWNSSSISYNLRVYTVKDQRM